MSTEFINLHFGTMRDDLIEYINDELLDMLDEFTEQEIADAVLAIASHLSLPAKEVSYSLSSDGGIWDYQIKVSNTLRGFVSCSNDECTGVSRTLYYPFFKDDEDGYFAGLCSLVSMINEAWYLCNSEITRYNGH